jgi:hypothetical protein
MKKNNYLFGAAGSILCLAVLAAPAWARGGGRFGVYLGLGPFWYGGPYNGSYWDPYYAYPYGGPSYPVYVAPQAAQPAVPDDSRHDLEFISAEISKAREAVNFADSDGDLSKEQLDLARNNINDVEKESRAYAAAGGGTISGAQERQLQRQLQGGPAPSPTVRSAPAAPRESPPPNLPEVDSLPPYAKARHDMKNFDQKLAAVRALLDEKASAGDITQAQKKSEAAFLADIERAARAQAVPQAGLLTSDQEEGFLHQLLHAEYIINQNFVVH